MPTAIAVGVVFALTSVLALHSARITRLVGRFAILVSSNILGLVTLALGVAFVRDGLGY